MGWLHTPTEPDLLGEPLIFILGTSALYHLFPQKFPINMIAIGIQRVKSYWLLLLGRFDKLLWPLCADSLA